MGDPIRLTDGQRKRLADFLDNELSTATRDVHDKIQAKHKDLNSLYYGEVSPRKAEWMSNFPVLMGATFTDSVTARFLNTLFAYKPTFTYKPTRNSGWTKVAKATQDMVQYKVETEMLLYREMRKAIFEATRLGTGALLSPWVTKTEQVEMKSLFWKRTVPVTTTNGIVAKAVPMRDLYWPAGYSELEDMPWWSRRLYWNKIVLHGQKREKIYADVDEVLKQPESVDEDLQEAAAAAEEELSRVERYIGHETYLHWDLQGNGDYRRYVCTWHPRTKRIMRLEVDTYPRWPLSLFRYGPRDYGICGLGVMEMARPYDEASYALYNLLVDNFKIATMQCLKGQKGSTLTSDTAIYPGKLFLLGDPANDLNPFQMGSPFSLNPAFIRMIWELGERRTGVSDYSLGRESAIAGGRATATGTLALIQEGQRRFDLTIRDFREQMDDLGLFILRMIHDQLPRRVPYLVLGERGDYVNAFLDMPSIPPYLALSVVSSMSNVAINKEVEKADALATFQLLQQYYQSILQLTTLFAQAQDPGMKEVVARIMRAASEKCRKVLETYGEMAPEEFSDVVAPIVGEANA